MRQVGTRREPELVAHASGALLAQGARFAETIAYLAPSTFVPKGVYRYRSHAEANQHEQECLVRGMGKLAAERA